MSVGLRSLLEAVWRRAVRCAAGASFQHELPPLLKEMNLTDIRHRWIVQYLTFTRRCHIRSAPPTACAKLSSTSHCHATRGNAHSYRPFRASRQAGSVSFSNRAPLLWNALSPWIRETSSPVTAIGRDLARRFQIHESTVSRIWDTWIPLMHDRVLHPEIWPTTAHVSETLPKVFQDSDYCNTRVILDCTEMRGEKATNFRIRCQWSIFSSYKHYNTAKGLVGISPNDAITFVSDFYAGRSTDRAIVQHCGILEKLENGDAVMADRRFDIKEDCKVWFWENISGGGIS